MVSLVFGRFALQPSAAVSDLKTCVFRSLSLTARQNTVIVERWWQIPLSKEGSPPRLYGRKHKIYRMVEDTKHKTKDKMELLLTQTVPKLGGRGDTVYVKKSVGRNKLLPEGLAVYPSAENREMFIKERKALQEGTPEGRLQTRTGELTVRFLKQAKLEIGMPTSVQYQLTNEIVCRQFLRTLGVVVPTRALTLPEPITGLGDYWCEVSVNGLDTVRIPLSVVPFVEPRQRKLLRKQKEEEQTNPEKLADLD